MNYLEQIKGFWKLQEVKQLGINEIALYFYLLEVWNKTVWLPEFRRNNYKAMGDLGIEHRQTFKNIKDNLQEAGIIQFEQKNGDANCLYTMTDLTNFYSGKPPGERTGGSDLTKNHSGKRTGEQPGEPPVKINGNRNGNNTIPGDAPGGDPSGDGSEVEKQKSVTKFWVPLKNTWFDFYQKKFSARPTFQGAAPKNLKFIAGRLEQLVAEKGREWSEPYAVRCLAGFLEKAYEEEWLRKNFLLTNLATKFDAIVNAKTDATTGKSAAAGPAGRTNRSNGADQLLQELEQLSGQSGAGRG